MGFKNFLTKIRNKLKREELVEEPANIIKQSPEGFKSYDEWENQLPEGDEEVIING